MKSPGQPIGALALAACLALAMGGCGSGSSTSSSPDGANVGASSTATSSAGDGSQIGGVAAVGTERAKVVAAARSLFAAMGVSDYAKVCVALTGANRHHLRGLGKAKGEKGGCPETLATLIPPSEAAVARQTANAPARSVRTKGDTAFVFFAPREGRSSYVEMKKEGKVWKAVTLTPTAPPGP